MVLPFALLFAAAAGYAGAADWPTFGANAARTGSVAGDSAISRGNVTKLHRRWQTALGNVADSAPIYVRGMLYATANDGTTYGIDARSGKIVWHFSTHGPNITTATPVADSSGRWIFAGGVDGFVHKLSAASGSEMHSGGFPVRITRMPDSEKDASSLNLANGYLYAATSGYFGDAPPYDGHVIAIRLSDGVAGVFDSLCSRHHVLPTHDSCAQSDSGIWARGGVVVDPDPSMHGRIYATTGNGRFDANSGGDDYGDSVLALDQDASRLEDYYTPSDFANLENGDTDLGSSSPALLPRESNSHTPLLAVQGGKDATLHLLNREHLGHVGGELQQVDIGAELFSAPAVWRDSQHRTWIFLGLPNSVRAFRLETGARGKSRLVPAWAENAGQTAEGTSPIVSNGIVFVAMNGALVALDAQTGGKLWSGGIGSTHWQSPIAVNGWLYCLDEDAHLTAFSL